MLLACGGGAGDAGEGFSGQSHVVVCQLGLRHGKSARQVAALGQQAQQGTKKMDTASDDDDNVYHISD